MQTATHYNVSVWCLVHLNPNGQKLVGHLGSMLERKVTDLFCTTKECKTETTFTVTQKKARGRDVPEWKFRVLPVDGWGRPEQISSLSNDSTIDVEDAKKWLEAGQHDIAWPAYLSDIKKLFKERGNVGSNDTLQEYIKRAICRRLIVEQPKEEWADKQRYPKYYLNID